MPENLNPEHQLEYLKELRAKYEEALGNAEKTGDYTEAEKLKEELDQRLTALEELFPKPEAEKDFIESNNEVKEKGETSYERAQEIMKEDFFGWEAIKEAFNMDVGIDRRVPYSEAELEGAKAQGEMLVYRVDIGLTMEQIITRVELSEAEGKLLYNTRDYRDEDFFIYPDPRSGWALVGKDILKDSTSKNYIDQTRLLRDHLSELGSLTKAELEEVTDDKLDKIRELITTEPEFVSKQLSKLKINQNHRRTPVEALYDFVIRFKNTPNKDRMLESFYDWTNTLTSSGRLVNFGHADAEGAGVGTDWPGGSFSFVGVVSVR